jgi:hypothetical protein
MQTESLARTEESEVVAANLLDNVENGIWHAFDYLALEGDATAPKTKLKVCLFFGGQQSLVPLLLLDPPFFPIILF